MVITQYGRVELDPMRVPQAASMRSGLDDTFQSRLQAAQRAVEPPSRPAEPRAKAKAAAEAADAPARPEAPAEPAAAPPPAPEPAAGHEPDPSNPTPMATDVAIDVTDHHTRGGEAERRIEAGKGSTSSLAFTAAPSLPAVAATAVAKAAPLTPAGFAPMAAAAATGSSQTSVANAARTLLDAAAAQKAALPRSEVNGYRTLNAQSVNLLEQARDSVFKQIMLKLTGDGGEMRMRLEPPDLGELDLHMVVEKGGSLRLSIGAERQDVQLLLQRHLDELKQTLQQNGFAIAHAEVRTHSDASGRRGANAGLGYTFDTAPGDDSKVAGGNQHVNYINAQGLDFWV